MLEEEPKLKKLWRSIKHKFVDGYKDLKELSGKRILALDKAIDKQREKFNSMIGMKEIEPIDRWPIMKIIFETSIQILCYNYEKIGVPQFKYNTIDVEFHCKAKNKDLLEKCLLEICKKILGNKWN